MRIVELKSKAGTAKVIIDNEEANIQGKWIKGQKFYESRLLDYIYDNFSGGVFIDCGSNIGNHSLFFGKFCSPDLVISIEPVTKFAELQKDIFELNGIQNKIKILNVAVSDLPRMGAMERFGEAQHDGMQRLIEGEEIEVDTLDNIVLKDNLKEVNIIKMDIEYEELKALKGAKTLLAEQSPTIFVETDKENEDNEVIAIYLATFGYKLKQTHKLRTPMREFVKEV